MPIRGSRQTRNGQMIRVVLLKHNKWARRGIAAVASLLMLWLVLWLAAPPIAKHQIQRIASEQLGREVSLGKVAFKPWSLEITIDDLRIAGAGDGPPQIEVRRLHADAEMQSLLRLAPIVDALRLERPVIRFARLSDGRYDFDDVLARLAERAPPEEAEPPSGEPARFAIYNIAIADGAVVFDDQPVQRQHTLRNLELTVPFISSLPSQRDIKVEPRLAFVLNDSPFDSAANTTPFADDLKSDLQLRVADLDVGPYLGYLPSGLPLRLLGGRLDADLTFDFQRSGDATLRISGGLGARDVRLADGADVLALAALRLTLADVRPLSRSAHLAALEIDGPWLTLSRDARGRVNLAWAGNAENPDNKTDTDATAPAWTVRLDRLALQDGRIGWRDATTAPAAAIDATDLQIHAEGIEWPMTRPARASGSLKLAGAHLAFSGEGTDQAAQARLELDALPLTPAAPYLAQVLAPTLDGRLGGQLDVQWNAPDLRLGLRQAELDGLALTEGKETLASIDRVEVADAQADLAARTLAIGRVNASQPRLVVARDEAGRWMFERWFKADGAAAPAGAGGRPWNLAIADLGIDNGRVSYSDKAHPEAPVNVELTALRLKARRVVPDAATASPIELSGRIGVDRRLEPGRFEFKGRLALQPFSAQGRLAATAVPAHVFKAYYADALNVDIRRAYADYRGTLGFAAAPAGTRFELAGDTAINEFRADSASLTQRGRFGDGSRRLMNWKSLDLRGLRVAVAPDAPPEVEVRETTLTDAFARLIVEDTGRLNLQNLIRQAGDEAAGEPEAAGPTGGSAPSIRFGPVNVVNATVDFTDLYIQPNYSADLSELHGSLSAFSSLPAEPGQSALADLQLRGKAQQTADLDITGKLNPLVDPLELDITARMRDLDLPPLSTYSVRYAGHGIERGKLSLDVNYQIAPDGRLTATNQLVLNQLQFGDAVQDAPNSLPVRLAVALLADRNGVIDVDLPLSGSINDPQFRIGPLIWRAVLNLITKAVTAPFSLLAGGLGGGADGASVIAFAPGSAVLDDNARQALDKIAQALGDRPALRLTVTGQADLARERQAWQRQRLNQMLLGEKRRAVLRARQDPSGVEPVTEAEYPELLEAVYRRADLPDKPRNLVGMAKRVPTDEMERHLLASIAVSEQTMRELAEARGTAVRDHLAEHRLASDRLFLGGVRTRAEGEDWKPGVEMKLDMR